MAFPDKKAVPRHPNFFLSFLRPVDASTDLSSWADWLLGKGILMRDAGNGLIVFNYDSEPYVHFRIEHDPDDAAHWPTDWPILPEHVAPTGLWCVLPCWRPSYFGLEAAPLIAEFAAAFGLLIFDDQEGGAAYFGHFSSDEILARWNAYNDECIAEAATNGVRLRWLPKAKSLWWWRSRRSIDRQAFAREGGLGPPDVDITCRHGQDECQAVLMWRANQAAILPEVDLVMCISHISNPYIPGDYRSGIVSADALRGLLSDEVTALGRSIIIPAVSDSRMEEIRRTLNAESKDCFDSVLADFVER